MNYIKYEILTCDLWIMIYIPLQQDREPIRIWSKRSCLRRIFLHKFCMRHILFTKRSYSWGIKLHCLVRFTNSWVLKKIRMQILKDHSDTICLKKQRKCQIRNPLSEQTLWDTTWNCTTPIQFQNSFQETSYIITCNINITRLRANTSRGIKRCSGWNLWPPLSLQYSTIWYDNCWMRMHPVVRMRRIIPAIVCWSHVNWPKPLNRSAVNHMIRVTRRDIDAEQKKLGKRQSYSKVRIS